MTASSGLVRIAPAALLSLAFGIGALTGVHPAVGVGLAFALIFSLVVIWDLAVGVYGFLLLTFIDVISAGSDISLTKAVGALLAGAWLASLAINGARGRELPEVQPWLLTALIAFLSWSALSAAWAESPSEAYGSTIRFGLNALLIPIVLVAVRRRDHVMIVFIVFIVGALLSVAWGLTQGSAPGSVAAAQVGRLAGATTEANVLATLLMAAVVFAAALAVGLRGKPLGVALAIAGLVLCLAAFFATFSRGGLVGLVVVLVAGLLFGGRLRPAVVIASVLAVLVGAVLLSTTSTDTTERLTSSSTSGRADIWTVGWRIVEAQPVVGVGSGNYLTAAPQYLLYPGTITRDDFIIDTPYAAHNSYLHVLAELGIVGLALFLAIVALCLSAAVRAVELFERAGDRLMALLGRALVIALVGMLATYFFVSEQYNKQLWLLLALGPALLAIARESAGRAGRPAA